MVGVKIKSAFELSFPSGRSLSRFAQAPERFYSSPLGGREERSVSTPHPRPGWDARVTPTLDPLVPIYKPEWGEAL